MSQFTGRKAFVASVLSAALAAFSLASTASAATWTAITIRDTPIINPMAGTDAYEFIIDSGGDKAALSTSDADGNKLGNIATLSINRTDDAGRFTAGSGPAVAPYLNFWITDGTHFAVAANEPSNPEWTNTPGLSQNMTWADLATKSVKIYENDDKSWLPNNGVGLTFADLADFTIQAPTVAQLGLGWSGLGTGAPRTSGNVAYGINWVFGDTLSNYVSGQPGYQVNTPTFTLAAAAVPTPVAALAIPSLMGLIALKRRRQA